MTPRPTPSVPVGPSQDHKLPKRLLTYQEASHVLSIKVNTLYALVSRRELPFIRLSGRMVRFDRDELERWIEERKVEPASEAE